MIKTTLPDKLKCLLTLNPNTNRWIARCLDFNIVSSGDDIKSAWRNLQDVIKMHIEECIDHSQENLQISSAPEYWKIFEKLESENKIPRFVSGIFIVSHKTINMDGYVSNYIWEQK